MLTCTKSYTMLSLSSAVLHRWGSAREPGFVLPASGSSIPSETAGRPPAVARRPSSGTAAATICYEQEALEPHWGLGVYQRVFLSESAAKAWYSWNSMRGDPAQPFHYLHLVQHVQQQV